MWPQIFQDEAAKIKEALGDNCIAIHHIGSTSVSELSAKPIIDILPVVFSLKDVEASNANMKKLGYEVKGEYGFMLRRFFVKENTFHVHVFEQGDPEIERHLKFRNWMISHPEDRMAYASLKEDLAKKYSDDRAAYCFGKDKFVANIDEKAGWHGIRIVKALTEHEWSTLKKFREEYFYKHKQLPDPYINLLNDPAHVHLVVLKKTDIIGYAHIEIYPDNKSVIHFIFISENKRNKNIGSELLKFIEKWLLSRDFKNLYSKISPETLGFLQKNGFQDMQFNNAVGNNHEKFVGKLLT
jgi:GrpB-like predicted nucleotidyltransferase (UPF0157 family)